MAVWYSIIQFRDKLSNPFHLIANTSLETMVYSGISPFHWKYQGDGNNFEHLPNGVLVGGIPTPLKNMTSSVGITKFPTEWKVIKLMFQTTNQLWSYVHCIYHIKITINRLVPNHQPVMVICPLHISHYINYITINRLVPNHQPEYDYKPFICGDNHKSPIHLGKL